MCECDSFPVHSCVVFPPTDVRSFSRVVFDLDDPETRTWEVGGYDTLHLQTTDLKGHIS